MPLGKRNRRVIRAHFNENSYPLERKGIIRRSRFDSETTWMFPFEPEEAGVHAARHDQSR